MPLASKQAGQEGIDLAGGGRLRVRPKAIGLAAARLILRRIGWPRLACR
jgi:hypothetical protein